MVLPILEHLLLTWLNTIVITITITVTVTSTVTSTGTGAILYWSWSNLVFIFGCACCQSQIKYWIWSSRCAIPAQGIWNTIYEMNAESIQQDNETLSKHAGYPYDVNPWWQSIKIVCNIITLLSSYCNMIWHTHGEVYLSKVYYTTIFWPL